MYKDVALRLLDQFGSAAPNRDQDVNPEDLPEFQHYLDLLPKAVMYDPQQDLDFFASHPSSERFQQVAKANWPLAAARAFDALLWRKDVSIALDVFVRAYEFSKLAEPTLAQKINAPGMSVEDAIENLKKVSGYFKDQDMP